MNHYELAAHLLRRARESLAEPIGDSGLGKVDDLFSLLKRLNKATPEELENYLESLHGAVEERPLAEQVVDALLAEDSSRYAIYDDIRSTSHSGHVEVSGPERDTGSAMMQFLRNWVALETVLNELAQRAGVSRRSTAPVIHLLKLLDMPPGIGEEIDLLRSMRNDVVHLRRDFSVAAFGDATKRIQQIIALLNDEGPSSAP